MISWRDVSERYINELFTRVHGRIQWFGRKISWNDCEYDSSTAETSKQTEIMVVMGSQNKLLFVKSITNNGTFRHDYTTRTHDW